MAVIQAGSSGAPGSIFPYLKEIYGPAIISTLNDEVPLWSKLKNAKETMDMELGGRGLVWPVITKRGGGVGFVAENQSVATAGSYSYSRAEATGKEFYGRLEITKKSMAASSTNKKAFARALDQEMQNLQNEFRWNLNRALWGNKVDDETTGILAVVDGAVTGAKTVNIDNGSTFHMYEGMNIRIATAADHAAFPGAGDSAVVDSIPDFNTFETVGNVTLVDNDLIAVGDANFTSYDEEITGVSFIVSDADPLYGLNPLTVPRWKARVDDNGGTNRSISHELMDSMFDAVKDQSGSVPNCIFGHSSTTREVKKLMEADVRYVPRKYDGGYDRKGLSWDNGYGTVCELEIDRFCPLNSLFFLSTSALGIGWETDDKFDWVDDHSPGNPLRHVADKVNFEAVYGGIFELISNNRRAHGVIEDITVNTSTFGL